jgi:hypothetical protein
MHIQSSYSQTMGLWGANCFGNLLIKPMATAKVCTPTVVDGSSSATRRFKRH